MSIVSTLTVRPIEYRLAMDTIVKNHYLHRECSCSASFGPDMVEEYFSSMKYRYIYFNCSKTRKKELMKKLKYPVLPYPKRGQ